MRLSPITFCKAFIHRVSKRRIISGPFAGLFYVRRSIGSSYYPKLIGSYEKELHPTLYSLMDEKFEKIIVIGAGEGYYAVGLTKLLRIPLIAYESDAEGRELITRLSLINRCNVFIQSRFEAEIDTRSGKDLIVMDIEGDEQKILSKFRFQQWRDCTIVVEVHGSDTRELLEVNSTDTHKYAFVPVETRILKDYPIDLPFRRLLKRYWLGLLQEWRNDSLGWLIFRPRE